VPHCPTFFLSHSLPQVTPAEVEELEGRLRGINSMAQMVRAERANVGVDYVLGVGGFDLDRVEGEVCMLKNHVNAMLHLLAVTNWSNGGAERANVGVGYVLGGFDLDRVEGEVQNTTACHAPCSISLWVVDYVLGVGGFTLDRMEGEVQPCEVQ